MSSISSTRLKLLKEQLFHGFFVKKEWWGDDLTILDTPEVEKMSISLRKALAFEKVCLEMPLEIKPHELIVGLATMSSVGFGHTFPKYETDEEAKYFAQFSLDRKSVWGHHMPYYKKLLEVGYSGILAEIGQKLKTEADPEVIDFLTSAAYTLKAATALSKRYEALLRESAQKEQDDLRRTEL
ncbi:MAG TPA: pyruvate formate lyase family protein, partial [Clostridia bacterium]|nr:pyruvate formate lyase family protein [Clostridia bacterium]